LKTMLARSNITYIDAYDAFIEDMQMQHLHSHDYYLFNDPMHFSVRGHRM